jgi:hypothetical protein
MLVFSESADPGFPSKRLPCRAAFFIRGQEYYDEGHL